MDEEPFWPAMEELLGLAHLAALQVAHLGRQPLDAAGDHGERGEEGGMAVARDRPGCETGSTVRPSFAAT